MSFLNDLLNPAPTTSSDPRPSQSQSQMLPVPDASYTRIEDGLGRERRGSSAHVYALPTVPSSIEAASAPTALATSGSGSHVLQRSPPTNAHFVAPSLPPLHTLPPLNATAQRTSHRQLPLFPFSEHRGPSISAHALPSPPNDLGRYRSSRSPDEVRRQSLSQFEPSQFVVGEGATQLAPLNTTNRDQGLLGDSTFASSASQVEHHSHHYSKSIARTSQPPQYAPSHLTPTTKKMEEDGVPQLPATAEPKQIRQTSAAAPEAVMTPQAPEPAERKPLGSEASPKAEIKDEPMGTPMQSSPARSAVRRGSTQTEGDNIDEDTKKAIQAAKGDFGRKAARAKPQPSIEEPPPSASPPAQTDSKGRKRPAPKVKKGQATLKKNKKRKIDGGASDVSRLSPGRAIKRPPGSKKSKSNTPALGSSPAPGSVASQDESAYASDASSDMNEAYCICRRGDNHTWMIACDGGCDDWYHGKCVNILEEDGELIDKYICPDCAKKSDKVTTWLPGCRNQTCRRPARIRKGNMSKYCSERCGREFMEAEVRRSEGDRKKAAGRGEKSSRLKRKGITMAEMEGEPDSDEDLGPRGGALKASELKALVASSKGNVSAFRSLGTAAISPPATVSPSAERFPADAMNPPPPSHHLTSSEQERIRQIGYDKDDLRRRRSLLKDREKFGQLIRENVARYAEREKLKAKDICGYDNRLTWSEEEFKQWRESEDGNAALSSGLLELPKPETHTNGDAMDIDTDGEVKRAVSVFSMCTKKRCERHRQWQKQALADVRFEESTLADDMRGLEKEEREIRELGALRERMNAGGLSGEGTVEVVGEA